MRDEGSFCPNYRMDPGSKSGVTMWGEEELLYFPGMPLA